MINPRWIDSIKRHGYKGAFELAATVDYLYGYDATARIGEDWMYERVTEAYVFDADTQRFLKDKNPWALPGIIDQLEIELAKLGLSRERFTLRMTGCPNGCARPYNCDIGLVGKASGRYTLFVDLGDRMVVDVTHRDAGVERDLARRTTGLRDRDIARAGAARGNPGRHLVGGCDCGGARDRQAAGGGRQDRAGHRAVILGTLSVDRSV